MGVEEILAQIDADIVRLQRARALLVGKGEPAAKKTAKKPGRKKRTLSPEGRKRIAEAAKRRWAEQRKAASQG